MTTESSDRQQQDDLPIEVAVGRRVWMIVEAEVQQVERHKDFVAVETAESTIDLREVLQWGLSARTPDTEASS